MKLEITNRMDSTNNRK